MKYDFSTIGTGANDPFTNLMCEVSSATNNLLFYSILSLVIVVLFFTYYRRTQDFGKSALSVWTITTFLSLIGYYWGKSSGCNFVSDYIMLVVVLIMICGFAFNEYSRRDQL